MLTVHKMPLKNQFLTGISFGYDKISYQNELQPFTSGYTFDLLGKESYQRLTTTFAGTGIVYNTMIKPDVEMIPFDGGFDYTRFDFEIETAKSNKFMKIFASYRP